MIKKYLKRIGSKLKAIGKGGKKAALPNIPGKQVEKSAAVVSAEPDNMPPGESSGGQGENAADQSAQEKRKYRRPRRRRPKWSLADFPVDPVEGKVRFHDFSLPLPIMHAIADLNFQYCTPIQENALPAGLRGEDLVGRASTGTGKTAVFLITVFTRLLAEEGPEPRPGFPRALIIAPTRELVIQIAKDAQALSSYTPLAIAAVYGGTDYDKQRRSLTDQPVDVLVATPGRLLDYARKKVVRLSQVQILVIDEADRMLDMGFIPDVRNIVYQTPPKEERQTMLFSATVTEDVKHLASQWCRNPVSIETESEQVAVETVRQVVYLTTAAEKYSVLYNLITSGDHERIIVFTNMKSEASKLYDRLRRNGIDCALLTGDVPQNKRTARLENFRSGKVMVLIATDVAGRGIHIAGISHVVNYTLPYEPEDYVHRIGRTGRAGFSGISISFADEEGAFYLPEIEEYIGEKLPCVVPDGSLLVPAPKTVAPPPTGKRRRR